MEEITQGRAHPLESAKSKIRNFLLSHGFDEVRLRDENWQETIDVLRKKKEIPFKLFSGNQFALVGTSAIACTETLQSLLRGFNITAIEEFSETKKISENPETFLITLKEKEITRVFSGKNSIEEILYPQFHEKSSMTDEQIASMIQIKRRPETDLGKVISDAIVRTAEEKCQQLSPCRFRAYGRELREGKLEIWLIEQENNKRLCGPDFLNRICVYAGNILALPPVRERGVKTGVSFIKAFADYVASAAENINEDYKLIKVGNVENWNDINLTVPEIVQNFIAENDRELSIKGNLDLTAEIKFKKWD